MTGFWSSLLTGDRDEPLPGGQQEGLALGPDGALWVADEKQGLLRFPGAEDALDAALAAETGARR
jgi:streptogramin lyase